jgi:hypothetical protein
MEESRDLVTAIKQEPEDKDAAEADKPHVDPGDSGAPAKAAAEAKRAYIKPERVQIANRNKVAKQQAIDYEGPASMQSAHIIGLREQQGKKKRTCGNIGCTKKVRLRGMCQDHGGGKPCSVEGCRTLAALRGLCSKHGGSSRCREEGCKKHAISGGLCFSHGGSNRKPCSVEGCSTLAAVRGLCGKHGGCSRCREEGCKKVAQAGGLCFSHGGGSKCKHDGCTNQAHLRGLCVAHRPRDDVVCKCCGKSFRKKGPSPYCTDEACVKDRTCTSVKQCKMSKVSGTPYCKQHQGEPDKLCKSPGCTWYKRGTEYCYKHKHESGR